MFLDKVPSVSSLRVTLHLHLDLSDPLIDHFEILGVHVGIRLVSLIDGTLAFFSISRRVSLVGLEEEVSSRREVQSYH